MRRTLAFTQDHFEQYPYAGDLFTHPFVQEEVAKYRANSRIAPFTLIASMKNVIQVAMPHYIDDKMLTPLDALEQRRGSCSDRAAIAYAITSQLPSMYSSYNGTIYHANVAIYSPQYDTAAIFDNNGIDHKNRALFTLSKLPLVPPFTNQRETVLAKQLRSFGDVESKRLLFTQVRDQDEHVYYALPGTTETTTRSSILAQHIGLSALQTIDALCTPAQLRAE